MTIFQDILAQKEREVSGLFKTLKNATPTKSKRSLYKALAGGRESGAVKLLAEIKKASPSKGPIAPGIDVVDVAQIYQQSGVAAISVLTDELFFRGSLADLHQVSREVEVPVLRKDFFIDEGQILEARMSEADAVLLMTSVLKTAVRLRSMREYAESLGMDALVETHSEEEIAIAVESGAKIIGVNARDFTKPDLPIDTNNFQKLLPLIPEGTIRVAESGIDTRADVEALTGLADAMLVGSSIMEQGVEGIEAKIKALKG